MRTRMLAVVALLCTLGCARSFEEEFVKRVQERGYSRVEANCMLGYEFSKMVLASEDRILSGEEEAARGRMAARASQLMMDCRAVGPRTR